jgi:hypothetical protein
VVSFDVAREGATSIPEALRVGLDRKGAIVVQNVDISISASAIKAEEETAGERADAVVWEGLEQSAGEETRLSVTYLCFMIVATMIAGIGVMLDQPILIVGAMVVGPEFGPLVAFCIGIVSRQGIRPPGRSALSANSPWGNSQPSPRAPRLRRPRSHPGDRLPRRWTRRASPTPARGDVTTKMRKPELGPPGPAGQTRLRARLFCLWSPAVRIIAAPGGSRRAGVGQDDGWHRRGERQSYSGPALRDDESNTINLLVTL